MTRRFIALSLFLALLGSLPVAAQTAQGSGRLAGAVHDEGGAGLPGVVITIRSPQMMGERTAVTEGGGAFAFPAVPAGVYVVRAELDGFVPLEQAEVEVRAGRTTELGLELGAGQIAESVIVVAETPVLDPEQVSTSQTFTEEYLQKASVSSLDRGYQSVLGQAAGVAMIGGSSSNPNVLGSTFGENAYYIDGIDSTDPVTATFGINLNFDTIQEINFETGGFDAQYGRATGGVVNVITKSGGNELSGTLDVRYRDNDFNTSGEHFDANEDDVRFVDPAATLGGPAIRDRLWFFASAEQVDSERTPTDAPTTRDFEGTNLMGKLTWQASQSWSVVARYLDEDAEIANANSDQLVAPEATRLQEQPTSIASAELFGAPSNRVAVSFKAAAVRADLNSFPQSGDLTTLGHIDEFGDQSRSVNYTNIQLSERDRDELQGSVTWFVDDLAGDHELKGGLEVSDLTFSSRNDTVGEFRYSDSFGQPFVFWFEPDQGFIDNQGSLQTSYVQDVWRLRPAVTLRLGVRYDQVRFDGDQGNEIADLSEVQPRLGIAWDLGGRGKTVFRASWGRFMHPNALTLPSFARQSFEPAFAYLSCSGVLGLDRSACQGLFSGQLTAGGRTVPTWITDPQGFDPAGWVLFSGNVFSSTPNTVAADLDPTYADELIVGVEHELGRRTAIGLQVVDKSTRDIFEDTCAGNVLGAPSASADCTFYIMANLPGLRREYEGALVSFESRATDWLHVLASYVYSKSEGNVEYTQNAGSDFDVFPDHFQNRFGFLSDDRRHRFKINGFVDLPFDVTLGVDAFWSSGFRFEERQAGTLYGETFNEARGARKANDNYRLDLQVMKGFQVGGVRLSVIAAVLNALDDEQTLSVCDRIEGCGGTALGDGLDFRQPRHYEAGFRIQF